MKNPTQNTTQPVLIALSRTVPEHILQNNTPLCDAEHNGESRLLEDDATPFAESSLNLCQDCAAQWEEQETPPRAETVRCQCDIIDDSTVYKCGTVVSASDARMLRNKTAPDGKVPLCPDCYEWVRSRETNSVELPYEEALSWAEAMSNE